MSADVYLPKDHPYVMAFDAECWQLGDGTWRVKWRDFGGVKQDQDFPSQLVADNFVQQLKNEAHIVNEWVIHNMDCWEYTFEQATDDWAKIWEKKCSVKPA